MNRRLIEHAQNGEDGAEHDVEHDGIAFLRVLPETLEEIRNRDQAEESNPRTDARERVNIRIHEYVEDC